MLGAAVGGAVGGGLALIGLLAAALFAVRRKPEWQARLGFGPGDSIAKAPVKGDAEGRLLPGPGGDGDGAQGMLRVVLEPEPQGSGQQGLGFTPGLLAGAGGTFQGSTGEPLQVGLGDPLLHGDRVVPLGGAGNARSAVASPRTSSQKAAGAAGAGAGTGAGAGGQHLGGGSRASDVGGHTRRAAGNEAGGSRAAEPSERDSSGRDSTGRSSQAGRSSHASRHAWEEDNGLTAAAAATATAGAGVGAGAGPSGGGGGGGGALEEVALGGGSSAESSPPRAEQGQQQQEGGGGVGRRGSRGGELSPEDLPGAVASSAAGSGEGAEAAQLAAILRRLHAGKPWKAIDRPVTCAGCKGPEPCFC